MLFTTTAIALIAASVPSALGWGKVAHGVTGLIATNLMTKDAQSFVKSLIQDESLQEASTWADKIKRSAGFASWSGVLHYVSTQDKPPGDCSYDDARDCADGNCIVGAIANFTMQADCKSSFSDKQRGEALKFITHFIGDITQPLHVCERGRGGNDQKVKIGRKTSKLHSIWDTEMPEKHVKNDFGGSAEDYAQHLTDQIKTGDYKSEAQSWLSEHAHDAVNERQNSLAAIDWATDSNGYDCTVVWPAYDENPDQDFGGAYYEAAVPVIDLQIAKAGFRLADWLDQLGKACKSSTSTRRRR
ncbi:hypothetical protein BATDEDRAFT_86767 [Batrachochytrium dendrobatidis JAM81]|uniref:S1/P1 Nuclease n=1 Tax=Batrachochytrium dendrobatidis (strain JAM81 / FGSC 10211) TaxID=684364 RepID=F4NYK0_BATDJ|nr:uncharacterized protein BATDEDRAFT_86767 [Batrachochytrium dendrobatidis JAM81]EGF81726.1 hypothetical protein BATDEDRAFT_86767 [Batrachochytrium dendrobatidis JAM81]|eukprot:XP_006677508.1 hypothetical protein BATDEDRAFT_86767 [Batrachochytrium dendrobatidis JAM81]